ncbi:beta-1,3-galactosyltransferase 5-like [Lineus longissimus]|uniref:beta-1,3-galactosyltransferase 5-like n=1 Tax=Lineus longissimus TaxID=88925 RepID=UPI00315D31A8
MPQGRRSCRFTSLSSAKTLMCVMGLFTTSGIFWLGHNLQNDNRPRQGYVKMNKNHEIAHTASIDTGMTHVILGLATSQTKVKQVKAGTFYDRFIRDYSGILPEWRGFPPSRYILNCPMICVQEQPELIVVVASAITHIERRQLIRENWGSSENKVKNKMTVVYIFGSTLDGAQQNFLQREKAHYNDVIQLDFLDTYRNLTIKSVAMLNWLKDFCTSARFVLKADDDMLINPDVLLSRLRHYQPKFDKFFLCAVRKGIKAVRSDDYRWHISEKEYSDTFYPTHCSGTAYAFSTSAVDVLLNNTLTTPSIWIEDIYISGMLATSIAHVHAKEFLFYHVRFQRNKCLYRKQIAMHMIPMPRRKLIYAAMRKC